MKRYKSVLKESTSPQKVANELAKNFGLDKDSLKPFKVPDRKDFYRVKAKDSAFKAIEHWLEKNDFHIYDDSYKQSDVTSYENLKDKIQVHMNEDNLSDNKNTPYIYISISTLKADNYRGPVYD
jgi:hypothetical protein